MTTSRATIRDVAQAAGVSPAAVSKVLNDGYGVSDAMRARVAKAITDLDYRPSSAARALRGRSHAVGVLADVRSPIVAEVLDGIAEDLSPASLDLLVGPVGIRADGQRRSVDAMVHRQVDGLILVVPALPHAELETLAQATPTVVIGRHGGGAHFDSVMDDDAMGARLAVEHLIELGHQRIAHIAMPHGGLTRPSVLPQTARADGYVQTMRDHGLTPEVITTEYTERGGYTGAMTALGRDQRATAVFAGNDSAALGVMRAAHELGLRVPEDVSVVGADNISVTDLPQIALTTLDPSGHMNGVKSGQLLRERIDGRKNPVTFSIVPSLVLRRSTGVPQPD